MNDSLLTPAPRQDVVALPVIWVAILVSLLLHGAALWGWHFKPPEPDKTQAGDTQQRLRLRLTPPASTRSAPPPPTASATPRERPTPETKQQAKPQPKSARPVPPRTSQPPVIALATPAAPLAMPPASPPPSPQATRPPAPQGDFSAMLEARRRTRAAGSDPNAAQTEDENARRNRIAAANIAQPNSQVFGYDPTKSGGVFQIERMGFDYAEFLFFGWNQDIKRRSAQRIEVRKGNHPDMRIAVVRRMISIIREHEQGDFVWHSNRLGRDITLSARPADSAGLEEVMMKEFF